MDKNLGNYIESRRDPSWRENIDKILRVAGVENLSDYANITLGLGLNDTLWIKEESSEIKWKDVSLYGKHFNDIIAHTALYGNLDGKPFSSVSPEFNTSGQYAKCWNRQRDGSVVMFKRGETGYNKRGLEPYSEYYASQVLEAYGIEHIDYELCLKAGEVVSKCKLFTSEEYGLLTLSQMDTEINSIDDLYKYYSDIGLEEYISNVLVADALILNDDRHLGNLGFIIDNTRGVIIKPAPLYDHNLSMLCNAAESELKNKESIEKYLLKNNKGHNLGGESFESVAKQVCSNNIKQKLIEMRNFKFKGMSNYSLPEWRVRALELAINNQIDKILN